MLALNLGGLSTVLTCYAVYGLVQGAPIADCRELEVVAASNRTMLARLRFVANL